MSKRQGRARRPVRGSVARLLDAPHLARLVPHLAPETLHQVIRHRGLHACGELVASATPEQLTSVLDLDVWHHAQPGRDEQFDADRFGEWVEVLVDTGETVAARIVAGLDEHLVIAGLSRYVRVFDPAAIAPPASIDDELVDRNVTPPGGLECELGGYLVRAIRADAWDTIVALLLALDATHGDYFHAVMRGCRHLSNSMPEVDGLDDLLLEPEQLLHDVALRREDRRSPRGYSTPADAPAFLQMARQRRRHPPGGTPAMKMNQNAAADFRPVHDATDDTACFMRSREMAFLANILMAGCTVQSRPFTAQEASDAIVGICNLGLEHWPVRWPDSETRGAASTADFVATVPDAFLVDHDLVMAFELGWTVLHEDVSMFVAEQLIATLTDLRCVDAEIQDGLDALRRELVQQRDAGAPWRARDALDVLAMLDMPSWASLLGLLDECPVLPAALTAILEGRIGAVSATAFEFIATTGQIGDVRAFMERLLDALRG